MHFALLAGIDARISQKDGPVSDRLALPGGRGAPNLRRGPQYPVEMGPGGGGGPKSMGAPKFYDNGSRTTKSRRLYVLSLDSGDSRLSLSKVEGSTE